MMFGSHTKISQNFNGVRHFLRAIRAKYAIQLTPSLLIQDVSDTQQVFRRPEMDVDFFRRPGIGMPENCADELHGDAFSVQRCGEIVPQGMRPEARYPGVPGQTVTKPVKAAP